MNKCLCCYRPLDVGQKDFHPSCAKRLFGRTQAPLLPYTRDNMSELARKVIMTSTTVTGVQTKMSLGLDRGRRNEPDRLTIVGVEGKYILKPQSERYPFLPELEDATMHLAQVAGISTVPHTLIRLQDEELAYLTLRVDRKGKEKVSMLDFCQLSNRLTEHKYMGNYVQLAGIVRQYSAAPGLDLQRFWEIVVFSWITGNSDMHCKNFSLLERFEGEYTLSPAYDLLAVLLADKNDAEELALPLVARGPKTGLSRQNFVEAMAASGLTTQIIERILNSFLKYEDGWFNVLESSFLPKELIESYKSLVTGRISLLCNKTFL